MSELKPSLQAYLRRKQEIMTAAREARDLCRKCRKARVTCYCEDLAPIESSPRIVILMHPLEERHPIGTGRMAHQSLANSRLLVGNDFSQNDEINALIADPRLYPMILFPGPQSQNLSTMSGDERGTLVPEGRTPVVIVLDGTWHTAKKLLRVSPNLQKLPRICFSPQKVSEFQIRKQPHEQCLCTIEAIHEVIELFQKPSDNDRRHDLLLRVFRSMVSRQLGFRGLNNGRHRSGYLARKARRARHREQKKILAARKLGAQAAPA